MLTCGDFMNRKKFTLCSIIITLILVVLILLSILVEISVLVVPAFITGLAVMFILRSRVETVTVDERIHLIHEKASTLTLQIFVVGAVLVGFVLMAVSSSGYADLSQSGGALLYSASALSILHLILWHYYRRKYGG
jgi:uncharacterized membrane protein